MVEQHDWSSLEYLEQLADSEPAAPPPSTPTSAVAGGSALGALPFATPSTGSNVAGAQGQEASGMGIAGSGPGGSVPVAELMTILAPLLTSPTPPELNVRQIIHLVHTVQALGLSSEQQNPAAPIVLQRLNRRSGPVRTSTEARNELQFNALLLTPHQVEVLFVLCTLLGGRRKIDVQQTLAGLDLIPVLTDMFDRLSWGCMPPDGPNPLERIHGPGCECNPESALRVQFLRLLHNFCDRDVENNAHKHLLLSEDERRRLEAWDPSQPSSLWPDPTCPKGLLNKIIEVLMKERSDSIYRFWLASCVESFLRGSSPREQLFVAETGLLKHLLGEILSEGLKCAGSLQTAFDLLGELSKCNPWVLQMLDASLSEADFRRLMEVVVSNLVDSNVFIRSLLLSLNGILNISGPQDGCDDALNGLGDFAEGGSEAEEKCQHEQYHDFKEGDEEEEEEEGEGEGYEVKMKWDSRRWHREDEEAQGDRACGARDKSYLLHSWWDLSASACSLEMTGREDEGGEEEDGEEDLEGKVWCGVGREESGVVACGKREGHKCSPSASGVKEVATRGKAPVEGLPFRTRMPTRKDSIALRRSGIRACAEDGSAPAPVVERGPGRGVGLGGREQVSVSLRGSRHRALSLSRLGRFLSRNHIRLLRDLMSVVDLKNVNHENICCLNTAVVMFIFAHRR